MQWVYQGWLVTSLYKLKALLTKLLSENVKNDKLNEKVNEVIKQVKKAKECLEDENTELLAYIVERDPESNEIYISAILAYTEEDEVEPTIVIFEQPIYPYEKILFVCVDVEP